MRQMLRFAAALAVSAAVVAPVLAQQPAPAPASPAAPTGSPAAPPVAIRFEINPLVECYFYLKYYTKGDKPQASLKVDFNSEVSAFNQASTTIQDPAAWRWIEDQVVAGPDAAAIREAAKDLPPALQIERSRAGIGMVVDALVSAYPKFTSSLWVEHQKSLNRIVVMARKKYIAAEDKIAGMLMAKMGFAAIDAPVTVYAVVNAGRSSAWGKAGGAYYTVIGTRMQSVSAFLETGLHEATHVIDNMQPYAGHWLLKEVRQGIGKGAPAEAVDTYLHGIMTWNAGSLVRRFVDHDYSPAGVRAPELADQYAPYMSTYQYIWEQYLDGRMSPGAAIKKLVEEFQAVQKLQAAPKAASPAPAPPRP